MNMDQSIRDTLNQLVNLQAQQLNAINAMASSNNNMAQKPAQFSDYSNYAPNFNPPMSPFSQSTQAAQQRFSNYSGQLTGGASLSDLFFANQSKMSPQSRNQMATDYGARLTNTAIAGAGVVASGAANLGAMSLAPGLVSGVVAGTVGGAVVGGLFDIALQQNQQHLAYNSFLQRESYRFINPMNSKNERDISGFSTSERYSAATYLRHFGVENKISTEDTSQLLESFTEGNMFKGIKDLQGFKDKMQKMTQYVKQGALLLNESFTSISTLMSDMQKAGIDSKNFDYLAAKASVVGSFTGQTGGVELRNAVSTSSAITQGTNFTNTVQTDRILSTNIYMDAYYQKMKDTAGPTNPRNQEMYNLITNAGGVQGASNVSSQVQNNLLNNKGFMSNAVLFYDYNKDTNAFTFNPEAFKNFTNSNIDANKQSQAAVNKLNSLGQAGSNTWMRNGQMYLMNSLNDDQSKQFLMRNLKALQGASGVDSIRQANLSYQDIMSLVMGDNSNEAKLYGGMLDFYQQDAGTTKRNAENYTYQKNMIAKLNANRAGFGYEVKNVWEGFKAGVGDLTVPIGEGITNLTTKVSDWWYGKQYPIDRSGTASTPEAMKTEGTNIVNHVLKGVQEGLRDAKSKGFDVKDDVMKMFSVGAGDMNDWKNKVIEYKADMYKTMDDLRKETGKYADTIRSASSTAGVSETTVVGMMKYGKATGTTMGMSAETMSDISKSIDKNIYTAGEDEKYKSGIQYLGQLMTAYGGNQDLANAAFSTSKATIDAALKAYGVGDVEAMRKAGTQNSLQGVKYTQIQNFINSSDQNKVKTLQDYIGMGGKTTFDPTQKAGLGANPKAVNMIRSITGALGSKDENVFAALIATESGGNNITNINKDGSTDYGPAQLNENGLVKGYIGKTLKLPSGREVLVNDTNWKTDYELNMYIGMDAYNKDLTDAKGNAALAYSLYNAYSVGPDKTPIMDIVRTRLKSQGIKDADMDKTIAAMTPDEISSMLQTAGGDVAAQNVQNFSKNYYAGMLPGVKPETIEKQVMYNTAKGRPATDAEKKDYLNSTLMPNFTDATSFNYQGFAGLYNTFMGGKQGANITDSFASSELSPYVKLMKSGGNMDMKLKEPLYVKLGEMWGINYDGSPDAFNKITSKMSDEYQRIESMMQEYDMAPADKKADTKWAQLNGPERSALIAIDQIIRTIRGDSRQIDPSKYSTPQDVTEGSKIITAPGITQSFKSSGIFGKPAGLRVGDPLLKDENKVGGVFNFAKLLNWQVNSGLYTVGTEQITGNTSIGKSVEILEKQLTSLETEQKQARSDADALSSGDIDFGKNISSESRAKYQDLIRKAIGGDKDAKAQLHDLQTKLTKDMANTDQQMFATGSSAMKEWQDPAILAAINRSQGVIDKLQGVKIEDIKKMISSGKSMKSTLIQFGGFGATLTGMITGDEAAGIDFNKRFVSKFADIDFQKVDWNTVNKITDAGQQELVDKLVNQTGEQRKNFYDSLKSNMPEAEANKVQLMTEDALKSNDKNAGMKKVVDEIIGSFGAATKDITGQAAANDEATKTFAESSKKLTDEIVIQAGKFNDTAIALQKKQQELEKQQNVIQMQGSGFQKDH